MLGNAIKCVKVGRREEKREEEGETKSSCLPYRCSLPCKYFNGSRQSALPQHKTNPFLPFPGWHSYYNCKYELYLAAETAMRISRVAAALVVLLLQQEKPIASGN